jgi:hypothetical protein
MVVNDVEHELCDRQEVFTIEVANTHNYLVGQWMIVAHNACDVLEEIFDLLGKRKLTAKADELLQLVKKTDNVKFSAGQHTLILDKQGITHILGRHHPKYKLDGKAATMFPKGTTVDELTGTMEKIINKNPKKIDEIMTKQRGNGQFQQVIDGVNYQIGFKNGGRVGQFHIMD